MTLIYSAVKILNFRKYLFETQERNQHLSFCVRKHSKSAKENCAYQLWNPVCLIIPCHRVLGGNGSITGYGGGLDNKLALLRLEGIML